MHRMGRGLWSTKCDTAVGGAEVRRFRVEPRNGIGAQSIDQGKTLTLNTGESKLDGWRCKGVDSSCWLDFEPALAGECVVAGLSRRSGGKPQLVGWRESRLSPA